MRKKGHFKSQIRRKRMRNMRNKSCGNGSKNCVAFRNVMRNRIAIGNPSQVYGYYNKPTWLQMKKADHAENNVLSLIYA